MNEDDIESFANGMLQVRQVLAAASTPADCHPNNRFCNDNGKVDLPDLSGVTGQVLERASFLQGSQLPQR